MLVYHSEGSYIISILLYVFPVIENVVCNIAVFSGMRHNALNRALSKAMLMMRSFSIESIT